MDGKKVLYYGAIAVALFIGISVVVSAVWWFLSLVWAIVTGVVSLVAFVGVVYVFYKTGTWLFGGDDADRSASDSLGGSRSSVGDTSESRQDRLRRQYVEGQISEAEFERRIGEELETEEHDDIDRELADIGRELERDR